MALFINKFGSLNIKPYICNIKQRPVMTKKYKVIPIENFGVVVDDNVTATSTVLLPNGTIQEMDHTSLLDYLESESHATKNIIATFGKRLVGVPLIELVDTVESIARGLCAEKREENIQIFVEGYKANANKYSDEQVLELMVDAILKWNEGECTANEAAIWVLQSLQKQPIPTEVELEVDRKCWCMKPENGGCIECNQIIKITNKETNTITAVKASYDKEI